MKKSKLKTYSLSELENWIKKTYKRTPKNKLYLKVANLVRSSNSSERYFSLPDGEYEIENREWNASIICPMSIFENKEEMKTVKAKCKMLIERVTRFPSKLVFSLMDQSYSPIGTEGFWKYEERWNFETFRFEPKVTINKSGRLIGSDGRPLFGFHLGSLSEKKPFEKKIYKNILFEDLTETNLEKAKKLLLKQNLIPLKELKKQKFLLVVSPEMGLRAIKIERKLRKERNPDDVLWTPYLKRLNWAVILKSPSKPLIFQLRTEPDFDVSVFEEFPQKKIIISSYMRCNAGIGDWETIVGSFKKEVESEIY